MGAVRRALIDNAEALVFVVATLVVATLLVWWSMFASRLVGEVHQLSITLANLESDDVVRAQALTEVAARADRQRFMLIGEGSVFAAMLLVCTGALFLVARARRDAGKRMVRLLQFTTHELKTPIAGVRVLLQSLQLGSIPDEQRARLLAQGVLETERLAHLAETILAFQRATAKTRLKPVNAASEPLLRELMEQRRRTFGDDEVTLGALESAQVMVDRDAFRVVLENLLDNARKYGGGHVEMTAGTRDHRWQLEVKDRGEGFSPGEAERLFAPFERDDKSGVQAGSGLGLFISRQLLRAMGGDLSATSEGPGKGATFIVTLTVAGGERG
ncbi:MAG: HAMP domain-containing histidine kinase [Deltaproteobacteria bacterium]|nr:HAMP domain-containing histidine kinase [Deltaproteobacteria bacterium]